MDGTQFQWFFGTDTLAAKVAAKAAGQGGQVIRCKVADIPEHAPRTGWRGDDPPRSYQAGGSKVAAEGWDWYAIETRSD